MLFSLRTAISNGLFVALSATCLSAGELAPPTPAGQPKVAAASNEGELAMKGFQLPDGFKIELFAAEPHLANPVAFDIDHQNRFWVAETFRLHAGVTDIRGKDSWLDEDLAARTVDDRIALMKRNEGANFKKYEEHSDRVKLILDRDNDGKADHSTVFADGFNTAADGIGAGVLSRGGKVYFANIPNLWLLEDTDNDGVADRRESLQYGYGVRVGFLGHDLHGLIMGPDGKLYFSIGDRGASVEVDGRRVGYPDTGAVFRCNPDGSDLEVFAYGLRNPQELAFDEYGNLFTGDNNSDGGDRARIVYLVEGGDSGWRIGWQFLERPNARGAWNSEKMWHPQNADQPAYIIPPIANLTDGPSGIAFYPGTGLPEKFNDHFFLTDFHGGKGSGIYSFTLEPRGAGFELRNPEKFIWECLPTDVTFGLDGGLYFLDWVQGWGMTGKGRIYRVFEQKSAENKTVTDTRKLLMSGMKDRSEAALKRLLSHPDMRLRLESQFELASRGKRGTDALLQAARKNESQLGRLHGIWGLGQAAREMDAAGQQQITKALLPLASDKDAEVRAQVAKVLGDLRASGAVPQITQLLGDNSPRVRSLAGIAAGKIADPALTPAVINMLADNADRDPHLRHAGAFALAGIRDINSLSQAAKHASPSVRMGALLALRRLERAEIAAFLNDPEPKLVLEAARAINGVPISGAIADLAALAQSPSMSSASPELMRRIVNANFRYGTPGSAQTLANIAANDAYPEVIRGDALRALAHWANPSGRDEISGLWRPAVGPRSPADAARAIEPKLAAIIGNAPDSVRTEAAKTAAALKVAPAAEALLQLVQNNRAGAGTRVEALRALAEMNDERLASAVQSAQNDPEEALRREALRFQTRVQPSNALAQIQSALANGTIGEKQSALGTLGSMDDKGVNEILVAWLDKLLKGEVQKELQLDLIEAAAKKEDPEIKSRLEKYEASFSNEDPLAPFAVALQGGNAEDGRKIFFERAEAACMRCHTIAGQGSEGGQVGPELTTIGSAKDRRYLLESIVFPNKHIAEGFQSLLVTTKDGTTFAGIVESETDKELVLNSPEDGIVTIAKEDITARQAGQSSMPEGLATLLSTRDLRDLVEYLAGLK